MMKGVMLMAYGSPSNLREVEDYYTHIRGGRKPSESALADLVARYAAIGGSSPLLRITKEQSSALQSRVTGSGSNTRVYAAMKHSHPFIAETVLNAKEDGVESLLCIALAPHYSHMSIGSYIKAVEEANARLRTPIKLEFVRSWHTHPRLLSAWIDRIRQAERAQNGASWLVFSAHSLPERILAEGDPYRDQLLETSKLIANRLQRERWSFSFQSASHTGEPWLGPDILDHLESLRTKGERRFLLAPIGFVSDHLEILYDIDVECKSWANARNVELMRCESFNNSHDLVECLCSLVESNGFL